MPQANNADNVEYQGKKPNTKTKYPHTEKHQVVDKIHGEEVQDDYRWLEDETNNKVKKWVESQNRITEEWFDETPVEDIYQELIQDLDTYSQSVPIIRDYYYFWYEREPGQDQRVLYRSPKLDGNKEVVFDPNTLSDDASITLSFFAISKTGRYGVYGIQESGAERNTIYIRDIGAGEEEKFYYGRTFGLTWRDDEEGFYYSVSNYKTHGGDEADETHYQQVYYHQLGESRNKDKLLFNAIDYLPKDAGLNLNVSEDGRYLVVGAWIGWREKHTYIIDIEGGETVKLDIPEKAKTGTRLLDGYIYVTTDYQANNRHVLRTKIEKMQDPVYEWEEFIPEQPDSLLTGWVATKNQIIADYFHNVVSKPVRLDRKTGKRLGALELPQIADLSSLSINKDYEEFFYAFSTFFSPNTQYRFNPDTEVSELYWRDERAIDENRFEARQEWYESKDGTKVPMFIVAPKAIEKNGHNPVILNGYGGYGKSRPPHFLGSFKPWIERGGVYALANIRGGGEFGDTWHRGGIRENKQTSFDDFIAAAEYCLNSGLTKREKLAILGGSNGGLLTGVVMTQRPELFGAVVSEVPVLDMYRYHKFLLAYRWTHEWGHPDNKQKFEWLKSYSPYHRADENQHYPPLLLTAGINDTRVHPMHAWKMAAKLQNGHPDNFVLLKTEMKAGHGPGKGFYQSIHDLSEVLCFIMHHTGVEADATV